ncbi:RNA polymerase subunit sigma-70 [Synechococcus sp. Cruz-9H2]|nr:RNA polymerase subunit sigma-70 [Synechococcus sp. Cruz-9H2]MCP9844089.1 RNA polymerase subunit sigma-70 [Synechococcus sp. Edmonson 11F2]MCP9856275.1 RNA polymerase subunit sigma-70 [Synechococcus sp. Cruz-9C9]MCP9863560.1 RNA polymerase subunit sigma-70 [Synechococcus sp. Cruz-7E5]MCP9870756.1 RNA polymerase subunit sigma-70 [Synechococcus sp. Cruz-7B9]
MSLPLDRSAPQGACRGTPLRRSRGSRLRRQASPPSRCLQLVFAFPDPVPARHRPGQRRPCRQRPSHPHAAANALALEHMDLAEKIAGNFARRTSHSRDDLLQLATLGLIKAARRFQAGPRANFRAYARSYANGEITHFLRDHGFLLKLPPSWRELHARGQKLLLHGISAHEVPARLGITTHHWEQIVQACTVRVVAFTSDDVP